MKEQNGAIYRLYLWSTEFNIPETGCLQFLRLVYKYHLAVDISLSTHSSISSSFTSIPPDGEVLLSLLTVHNYHILTLLSHSNTCTTS
jgi:hypothetical protein